MSTKSANTAPAAPAAPAGAAGFKSLVEHGKSTFGNRDAILALIASAVASGGIGGALAARAPGPDGENKAQRRKRIIMNALGSGAAGAGVVGSGMMANSFLNNETYKNPGVASAIAGAAESPMGRGAMGAGGAIAGNRFAAKGEAKRLVDRVSRAPAFNPGERRVAPSEIDRVFGTAGQDPTTSKVTRTLLQDRIGQNLGTTESGTKNVIRGMGHTPVGESPVGAFLRRNFGLNGATNVGGRNRGINTRLAGGALGLAAGAMLPDAVGSISNGVSSLLSSEPSANAQKSWALRPVGN